MIIISLWFKVFWYETADWVLAYYALNIPFFYLFCSKDILLRHLLCLVFLTIEMDDTENLIRIVRNLTSIHLFVNLWDNADINQSFMAVDTLTSYSFQISIRICTFVSYLILLNLFFIYHNYQNHIISQYHFVISVYFISWYLYESYLNHAFILIL